MAATFAPDTHVRKRQYQPSIHSFFHHRDVPFSSAPERARSPMSAPLPEDTQASLLSVGMRVRKSVPEGYKTHKTIGVQEYAFLSTAPAKKMERTYITAPTKELTPFCGLHKTGGWGPQEVPSSSAPAVMGMEGDEDDLPGMKISQSTLSSTQGSLGMNDSAYGANSRKRTYEEEVEDELDAFFEDFGAEPATTLAHRPIARLKQQPKKGGRHAPVSLSGGNDFEDAGFLTPLDGMDVDEA